MSIIFFASVIGVLAGKARASFILVFSMVTGIIKKVLEITRNKKKKQNKIFVLAKSKLNSIATLIYQALIGLEISNEEFKTTANENEKYEKWKKILEWLKLVTN